MLYKIATWGHRAHEIVAAKKNMDTIVMVLFHISLGALLLIANIWFIRSVWTAYHQAQQPSIIAPFHITGRDDPEGMLGTAHAQMLQSRPAGIAQEMAATETLVNSQAQQPGSAFSKAEIADASIRSPTKIELPSAVFEPINLDIKVGDVQVGGVIATVQRSLVRNRMLQLTVHYAGQQAIVAGCVDAKREQNLWIVTDGNDREIIDAIAYTITQSRFADHIPQVRALEWHEFRQLLQTLQRIAQLNQQVDAGRSSRADFEALLPDMEELVNKIPTWNELIRVAAQVAENAGNPDRARGYYSRALSLMEKGDVGYDEIERRIAELTPKPDTISRPMRTTEAERRIRELIGVPARNMPESPKIAVLGGIPAKGSIPEDLIYRIAPGDGETESSLAEYLGTIAATVHLVAPDAEFVFTEGAPAGQVSSLIDRIGRLISEDPDILLIPLHIPDPIFRDVYVRLISLDYLIVISAEMGGDRQAVDYLFEDGLAEKLMIVSSIDESGRPTDFVTPFHEAFWAPGTNIPVQIDGETQARAGTGYSSALAAGAAAWIKAEHPELNLLQLLELIRGTSREIAPGSGVRVIYVEGALDQAGK